MAMFCLPSWCRSFIIWMIPCRLFSIFCFLSSFNWHKIEISPSNTLKKSSARWTQSICSDSFPSEGFECFTAVCFVYVTPVMRWQTPKPFHWNCLRKEHTEHNTLHPNYLSIEENKNLCRICIEHCLGGVSWFGGKIKLSGR